MRAVPSGRSTGPGARGGRARPGEACCAHHVTRIVATGRARGDCRGASGCRLARGPGAAPRRTGHARPPQRAHRHGRRGEAGGAGVGDSGRDDCRPRDGGRDQALHRAGDTGRRPEGRPGHSGHRREPRPLPGHRPGEAGARVDAGDELGPDCRHGRRRREESEARRVDRRARLAPGEMDEAAGSPRRGVSDARLARPRLARQPGGADARERPRDVREREGHGSGRRHEDHAQPCGRRDPERRGGRSDRTVSGDGIGPPGPRRADRAGHDDARPDRRRGAQGDSTRGRRVPEEGHHLVPRRWRVVPDGRPVQAGGAGREARRPPVRHGPRGQCQPGGESRQVPDDRVREQPRHPADHQGLHRRGAWAARRVAPRGPGEPRAAEPLRGGVQGRARHEVAALARRARAAPEPQRHPPVRGARRHSRDAGRALHVGCALRAGAPRAEARRRRRVRLAEADEDRRGDLERHRSRATTPR